MNPAVNHALKGAVNSALNPGLPAVNHALRDPDVNSAVKPAVNSAVKSALRESRCEF